MGRGVNNAMTIVSGHSKCWWPDIGISLNWRPIAGDRGNKVVQVEAGNLYSVVERTRPLTDLFQRRTEEGGNTGL